MANCSKSRLERTLDIRIQLFAGHDYATAEDCWSWKATIRQSRTGDAYYAKTPRQAVCDALDAYIQKEVM